MRGAELGRRDFLKLGFARDALRAREIALVPAGRTPWRPPNVLLCTRAGESVRLYEDLIRDRVVVMHLLCTRWEGHARLMRNLERVHQLVSDRFGRDARLLSLSIDVDHPAKSAPPPWAGGEREGWLSLTGEVDAIDAVRRALGAFDPNPALDADRSRFAGVLTLGSDRTGRWASLPALVDAADIVARIRLLDGS